MSLHSDLLAQAEQLARNEPTRPRQASLRRAISAAYYALFHLLTHETAAVFVRDDRLRKSLVRHIGHREMYEVSKHFASGEWPKAFDSVKSHFPVPPLLKDVAQTFIRLQQARHDADYNLERKFTRSDAISLVEVAKTAFRNWETIRKDDMARIYLSSFFLWDQWNRKR